MSKKPVMKAIREARLHQEGSAWFHHQMWTDEEADQADAYRKLVGSQTWESLVGNHAMNIEDESHFLTFLRKEGHDPVALDVDALEGAYKKYLERL